MIVAFKFRCAVNANHRVIVSAETAGLTCAAALLFHRGFKACFVNLDVALAADIRSQVNREAIGVIQTEGGFAVQRVAFSFDSSSSSSASPRSSVRANCFFGFQHLLNQSLLLFQLFTGGAHHVDKRSKPVSRRRCLSRPACCRGESRGE